MLRATTNNGATSLATTNDPRLDLFFKTTRSLGGIENTYDQNKPMYDLIDKSWQRHPLDTMKIIFNWRDCRGGKGDHSGFIAAMIHLEQRSPDWFLANFKHIPKYGCYLDLIKLWHLVGSKDTKYQIMEHIKAILMDDIKNLEQNDDSTVSLLAKWIPTENAKWDRFVTGGDRFRIALCQHMGITSSCNNVTSEQLKRLRREIITPLRKRISLVESKMCESNYDDIDYDKVPSLAMRKYRQAFLRNDSDKFTRYLMEVRKGTAKINSRQVLPHDLIRTYMLEGREKEDPVVEAMWLDMKKGVAASGVFDNSMVVCDVSGSMAGTPLEVAIALGLLSLNDTDRKSLITFSSEPKLHTLPDGLSLLQQINNVMDMEWGHNTDFEKTMELVLGISALSKDATERVYVFSDMQFDVAFPDGATNFEAIQKRFEDTGLKLPQIIFWNLDGSTTDFPVSSGESGVVMLSGYSPALLNSVISCKDVTPLNAMLDIIQSSRYDSISQP